MFVHARLLKCVSICVFNETVSLNAATHNSLVQVCVQGFICSIRFSCLKQLLSTFKYYILVRLLSYEAVDVANSLRWWIGPLFKASFGHRAFLSSFAFAVIVLSTGVGAGHGALIYVSHFMWMCILYYLLCFYFIDLKTYS